MFVGTPGPSAGHVAEASSYFDRLWKRENLVDRYFIVMTKKKKSTRKEKRNEATTMEDSPYRISKKKRRE